MFKKLALIAALVGISGFAHADVFKSVQLSTSGVLQAGTTGYSMHLGTGTVDNLYSSTMTTTNLLVTNFKSTNTVTGGQDFKSWTVFNASSSINGSTMTFSAAVRAGTMIDKSTTALLGAGFTGTRNDSSTYTFQGAGFQGTKTDNSTTTLQGAVFNGTAVDNSTVTHTAAQTFSSMTVTGAGSFSAQGTSTNDNAGILQIGWSTATTRTSFNVPASAIYVAYSTVTLQAGDYEIWGSVSWNRNGATFTVFDLECAITDTPGNSFTNLDITNSAGTNLGAANLSFGFFHVPIGPVRVSITTQTSYYVKAYTATYTAGTPQIDAYIAARRMR